jgi:peptide/nickel transport system permease protein
VQRVAPRLAHGGAHLQDPPRDWLGDVLARAALGLLAGLLVAAALAAALVAAVARSQRLGWRDTAGRIWRRETDTPGTSRSRRSARSRC